MKKTVVIFCLLCNTYISYSQWSTAVNISPGTTTVLTNENAGQCIAVSGDTVRVVYTDHSTALVKVMFNQSPDAGLTWGIPQILQTSPNCSFTAIANSGSNIHVVWMDSLGSNRASFYTHSTDAGISWQPVTCLDSVTKFWPGIACSGNLVIATLNKDLGGNTEVFIRRSVDNGFTWLAEQQISNAPDRSEDPAINMLGKDVHLSWNDKRSGTMNIYYCHSADSGLNWGPETALTAVDSYTSMVCLDGNHVDVPHAIRVANYFDVWVAESSDTGATFIPNQQLTNTSTTAELYPFMARDESNLHVVYIGSGGTNYIYSGDGGITWTPPLFLGSSSQPFIAYTGCVLHVIFSNGTYLNYLRDPLGNCPATEVENAGLKNDDIFVSRSPENSAITINSATRIKSILILTLTGSEILKIVPGISTCKYSLPINDFSPGIYVVKVENEKGTVVKKLVIE